MVSGERREMGLREVFSRAHEIKAIAGEMETQNASIFRLLLAILYAVHLRKDVDGNPVDIWDENDAVGYWKRLWDRGRFNTDLFDEYFDGCYDRFYLFHPDRPFYQANIEKGTEYAASKMIGELYQSANKPKLFAPVSGDGSASMSYAQSARWILNINSFDDAALKQQDKSDGSRSTKVGWLGRIGYVCILGCNLFETLMYNMVLTDKTGEPFKDGKAIWESESIQTKERVTIPIPGSPVELLTVQFRRIRLIRENGRVIGSKVVAGDIFDQSCSNIEQMTMWKKDKDTGNWIPKTHDPSKSAWRDYPSLLVRGEDKLSPGVIRWASALEKKGLIEKQNLLISLVGVQYGSMMSSMDDATEDSISISSRLLSDLGYEWNHRIEQVLESTDECMKAYSGFRYRVFVLNGISEGVKDSIWGRVDQDRAKIYFEMDGAFRTWLSSIDPDNDDMEARMNDWLKGKLRPIMIAAGNRAIGDSNLRSLSVHKQDSDGSVLDELRKFKNAIFKITGGRNDNIQRCEELCRLQDSQDIHGGSEVHGHVGHSAPRCGKTDGRLPRDLGNGPVGHPREPARA